jgi:hypothetical protein
MDACASQLSEVCQATVATIVATGHRNQGVSSLQSTRPRVLQTKNVRDSVTRDTVVEKGADKAGVTSDRIPKLDRPEVLPICIGFLDDRRRWGCIQAPGSPFKLRLGERVYTSS